MGNRKLQFAITRLKFHVAGISNFSKAFICCLVPPCCFFIKSKCITFIAQKTGIVQKSNKHIADGYKKLFGAFKRETVQFLVAKNLAVSHLPLEALPAVQT